MTNPTQAEIEAVARAICKSTSCRGISCCEWPANIGERRRCKWKGYAAAALAALNASGREGELEAALEAIDAATRSHVDGRDLMMELNPMGWHYCDIRVRINGQDRVFEGDWLKNLWQALVSARALRQPADTGGEG